MTSLELFPALVSDDEGSNMSRTTTKTQSTICKIVCFDEGSATDYIQIVSGGSMASVAEKSRERATSASGEVSVKAGIASDETNTGLVGKLVEKLTGIELSASAAGKGGMSFNTTAVAKSIVSNTVLTDFLEATETHGDIRRFEEFSIVAIDNSLASYALMTPYLAMLRGGDIPAGDFNLALDKLDSTIKDAKGYYEFLGKSGNEQIVFRFNRESFKNNYKATDLLRMNLVIYAVEVGTCSLKDLDVSSELNISHATTATNPDYDPSTEETEADREAKGLKVYDVLLAGVKANDREGRTV